MTDTKTLTNLKQYLRHRLGYPEPMIDGFIKAFLEFVVLNLTLYGTAQIRGLGRLIYQKTRSTSIVKFKVSDPFICRLKENPNLDYNLAINKIKNILNQSSPETFYQPSDGELQVLTQSLRHDIEPEQLAQRVKENYIQYHFIDYLQRRYPLRYDWQHPVTKKVYTYLAVEKACSRLRDLNTMSYKILLTTWISITERKEITTLWGLNNLSYTKEILKAVDGVLVALLTPGMESVELSSVIKRRL